MGFLDKIRSGKAGGLDNAPPNKAWDIFFKAVMARDFDTALSALDRLASLEPRNPQVQLKRAEILQRKKNASGAVDAYLKATGLMADDESGQKAKAVARLILKIEPRNVKAIKILDTPSPSQAQETQAAEPASYDEPAPAPDMSPPASEMPLDSPQDVSGPDMDTGGIELAGFDGAGVELEGTLPDEGGVAPEGADAQSAYGTEVETESYESAGDLTDDDTPALEANDTATASDDPLDWGDAGTGAPAERAPVSGPLDWGDTEASGSGESPVGSILDDSPDEARTAPGDDLPDESHNDGPSDGAPAESGIDSMEPSSSGGIDWGTLDQPGQASASETSLLGAAQDKADEPGGTGEQAGAGIAPIGADLWGDDPVQPEGEPADEVVEHSEPVAAEAPIAEDSGAEMEVAGNDTAHASPMSAPEDIQEHAGAEMDEPVKEPGERLAEDPSEEGDVPEIDPSLWEQPEVQAEAVLPPIFSYLSVEDIESIPEKATHSSFDHGEAVIREGDSSDSMFIIKAGSAKVEMNMKGKSTMLGVLEKGDFFGEVAFLTGRPRTATVTAEGTLEVMEIDRSLLQATIDSNPLVLDSLLETYKDRAREAVKKISRGG